MACRMCDNARVNPRLTDNDDLSYISVGDFAEKKRMMIRSGDGKPVEMLVEEHSEKSGWHLVGNYRPNFCPNCGRDLREDYVKRKETAMKSRPQKLIDVDMASAKAFHDPHLTDSEAKVIREFLARQETVDAKEVVHGRWLRSEPGYRICNHCQADVAIFSNHRNYCPNCGAKMDGDDNG